MPTFLSLDLELNNAGDGSTPNPKIIEVGICIGDISQPSNTWLVKNWYINPHEPIYPEITTLTGITDGMVQNKSHTHEEIALSIGALIDTHKPFVNPVTWGGSDSIELIQEFKDRKVNFPYFGRRWIDVKTICVFLDFVAGKSNPSGGLSSLMGKYKLKFQGTPHMAGVDAFNTLRLFAKLYERQSTFNKIKELSTTV